MSNSEGDFCGFLCEEWTEKQQEIVDEIAKLRMYNPKFADEFSNKLINMLRKDS